MYSLVLINHDKAKLESKKRVKDQIAESLNTKFDFERQQVDTEIILKGVI